MYFESWSEFVAMGGHALYVWLAYGSTVAVLLGSFVAVRRARRALREELRWAHARSGDTPLDGHADQPGGSAGAAQPDRRD